MIELSHVFKQFGERLAVEDLTLTVPRGEIFGLLGHNGAGKSTAIGMMLGQVWPTRGEVRVCGHDISTDRGQALQKVGAIFEAPAFYDYLSGRRNLEILSSYTAYTAPARIRQVVDWVGLTGRENSTVRTYSHGMRARLALAQALLPGPEILILDEPGSGLDPEGIHEMRQMIQRLHRELGLTILLSSHLLHEVEQVCSRIAVLNQGRKVFEGRLSDIHTEPRWIRIKTSDFAGALKILRDARMVEDERDGEFMALSKDIGTDSVVRVLVERGMPLYEIAPDRDNLESFYLGLMTGKKQGG
ncbi:MAG TPA: ABC transporter ATP-binding protein [Verrucomicrobiae bacterium]|nr:ABC transporter ATP-binding protein [Verrucomicrobiae bacterium]